MPKLGKGDKSWQRVQNLIEALLDYALNDCDRISNLHVSWKDDTSELTVNATLEALRHLVKDKNGFKPTAQTSEKQTRTYIGEVLTKYLRDWLKILDDPRPDSAKRGTSEWTFTLKLETRDKHENIKKLKDKWDADSKSTVTIEYRSKQNTSNPAADSEDSTSPQNTSATKHRRVVGLQNIIDVPVWKGRDEILADLTAKLLHPQHAPKVLAIIGQGGIGKTSLSVKLMEALGVNLSGRTLAADSSYDGALYFKVQEGTSFDDVAEFLLSEGLRIQTPEALKTADEKIAKIIAGFAQTRFLLVLDNLEDILLPANDAGGAGETPATDNSDYIPLLEAHRASSPEWGKLINALVYQQHQSQTIFTSREVPADLADTRYEGAEPDSELVEIVMLAGVSEQAGIEILQQRQLKDKLADLHWISQRVDGHVFLLTQLASLAKNKPGYLRKNPALVTKKAEPMLREQLARQSEAARDLMRRMCVLRVPIDIQGLTFLRLYTDDWEQDERFEMAAILEEPAELTEAEISETEAILEKLVDSSLVQSRYSEEKCEVFYDLHRVIVEFLQVEYQAALPKLIESVYKFYCTGKNVEDPKTLEDLRPVLEAQHFAFMLGNYSEAYYLIPDKYLRLWGYWNLLKELHEQILPHVEDEKRSYCLRELGAIQRDFGNWDVAENYFKDALSIDQEQDSTSGMTYSWEQLGYIESCRGNWDEAERLYRQCLEVETELGDRSGMASSWGVLGDIERNRGNWDEAERLYRQSLELRTELGDRSGMAYSWGALGGIEQNRGNWDQAEILYQQCLKVMTELGDRSGMATSWGVLGDIERNRGNWDEAERLYRQSLELRTELGDRSGMASSWGVLGHIERNRGNWDEAERLYRQSLELRTELGDRSGMASSWGQLGYIEGNRGNWDEAERLYRQCLEVETDLGDRSGMASSWGVLGDIERMRGNFDAAEQFKRQSFQLREQLGDREGMASSLCAWGEIKHARSDFFAAEQLYQQSLQIIQELGNTAGIAIVKGCLAKNKVSQGNLEEAEHLLTEALATMQELNMSYEIAEANYDLARLERKRNNPELAQQYYNTAHQIFQQLGAAKDLEKIDREWESD
jgi:tetratricopeptide (TPR) repeat protein